MTDNGHDAGERERVVLFYKKLVDPGGAERLLVKEFIALRQMGYDPYVLCYDHSTDALFGADIPKAKLINVSGIRGLAQALVDLGRPGVLCASGHIDVGLASLLSGSAYALHIHHPSFMTFNETDKYSLFQRRHFHVYTASNYGAAQFREIAACHGVIDKIRINLRAMLSIWAIRRSRCNFVLSKLAQVEKNDLFGIESIVLYGALETAWRETFQVAAAAREKRQYGDALQLLTLARLDKNKRLDELLRAVAKIVAAGLDIRLKIAGRGPELDMLTALAKELGLEDRVAFCGFVPDEDLPGLMQEADVFVSIDWADFKLTMYEALSHGVPILVSAETEVSDDLLATGYVHCCTPEPDAVVDTIFNLINSPPELNTERLAMVLETVTWRQYFRRIAEELQRHGVLKMKPGA